jgi:hypothetical protein
MFRMLKMTGTMVARVDDLVHRHLGLEVEVGCRV